MTAVDAGLRARPRVLVAGIGNIFFGDDAFGVEVVGRFAGRPVPAGVRVADYGIRGLHLAHDVLDRVDVLVLVDAMAQQEAPGTVSLVEVEPSPPAVDQDGGPPASLGDGLDAHSIGPAAVLASVHQLGGHVERVLVVGCQPATCTPTMGLSDVVAAAVDPAVDLIDQLLADLVPADPLPATEPAEATP